MSIETLKKSSNSLIVKNNFYAKSSRSGKFVFIPSGSSLKLVNHTISHMPYYELETYSLFFDFKEDKIDITGSRVINSKQPLKLRSCTSEVIDNKPQISSFNDPLLWNNVFVQSLEDVIRV